MNFQQLQQLQTATENRKKRLEKERDAIYDTSTREASPATDVWERIHQAEHARQERTRDSQLPLTDIKKAVQEATEQLPGVRKLRDKTTVEAVKGLCDIALEYGDSLILLNRRYFGLWELPHVQEILSKEASRFKKIMAGIEQLTTYDVEKETVTRLQKEQTERAAKEALMAYNPPPTKKWGWKK